MQLLSVFRDIARYGIKLIALSSLLVIGCGGGGGGSTEQSNWLWVSIDTQFLKTTVATASINLEGEAYCDNCPRPEYTYGYCSYTQPDLNSAIKVAWSNRTTGATGSAKGGIFSQSSWSFFSHYCLTTYSYNWWTSVPLALGDNVIEIMAYDASGNSGKDSVTIKRLPITGLNQPSGIAVDTARNEIFVASTNNSAIVAYERVASGNATPIRIISGTSTGLSLPKDIGLDRYNEILALNYSSITVHSALTASGDVTPIRTISGPSTGLSSPQAMAVDQSNDEIFVADYGNSSITVYALKASGDAVPLRTISGASTGLGFPIAIAVDEVNNEVFVTSATNSNNVVVYFITVYARTSNGDVAPIRTINGAFAGLTYPQGIAVDTVNNEIFVANNGNRSITVYARTASGGGAVPLRTISGASTGLSAPRGIAVDTVNNEIFVTDGNASIIVFPRTANGNAVPTRTITNPTAGL